MEVSKKDGIAENVEEVEESGDIQTKETENIEGEEGTEGEPAELELWEDTGEEDNTEKPEKTLKAKKAWKREKKAVNEELEKLKAENELLKTSGPVSRSTELVRPNRNDFDDDDEYEEKYEQYLLSKVESNKSAGKVADRNRALIDSINSGVGEHNERVGSFIEEKKINPDVYSKAESDFIGAIEECFPGDGEANADHFLSKLGTGSEKIPYYISRNKVKFGKFKSLLKSDPSGVAAAIFLGDQNRLLRGVTVGNQKTKARPPVSEVTGGESLKGEASLKVLKSKYDAHHKKDEGDLAWKIKRQAKKAGFDVSGWAST